MVTYDHWSNMTLLVTLQVMFTTLDGGIQIDRLFVACEKPRGTGELAGKWFFNRLPSDGGKRPGFCFRYLIRVLSVVPPKKKPKTSKIEFWPYQQIGGDISVPGIIDKT